jgi:predicted ArsR family transcriptional regulator
MATEGLSAAALRVLRGLAGSQGPMTVAELAESLGGHPNTMRLHLQSLLKGGWAGELLQAPHGRGRPARAYVPTAAGTRAASSPPAVLVDTAFVEALAEHLEALPQPGAAAVSIGRGWGERLGATRDHDGLVGAQIGQGFAAERTPDGLAIRSCPLIESASRSPDVVCGLHQGLIDALAPEPMTLAPFARPGLCVAVTPHA